MELTRKKKKIERLPSNNNVSSQSKGDWEWKLKWWFLRSLAGEELLNCASYGIAKITKTGGKSNLKWNDGIGNKWTSKYSSYSQWLGFVLEQCNYSKKDKKTQILLTRCSNKLKRSGRENFPDICMLRHQLIDFKNKKASTPLNAIPKS